MMKGVYKAMDNPELAWGIHREVSRKKKAFTPGELGKTSGERGFWANLKG